MTKVVVVCEDAGAAANLALVAAELRRRGIGVDSVVGRAAARYFGSDVRLAESTTLDSTLRLIGAPSTRVVVTGTSPWGMRLDAEAVLFARQCGRRTVSFLDYWANYAARLSYPSRDRLEVVPDRLAVVDLPMRDEAVAAGVPAGRIVVTGAPAFDGPLRRGIIDPAAPRTSCVLFVSQPIAALYGDALGYTEATCLRALASVVAARGLELVVRPHPREDEASLRALVARLPGQCSVQTRGDLFEVAASAEVVVGMSTMALVEVALGGIPTVSLQVGAPAPIVLPTTAAGVTPLVVDESGLARALDEASAIRGVPIRDRLEVLGWRPGATERMVELLLPWLGDGNEAGR